jgi:hypothetical protein
MLKFEVGCLGFYALRYYCRLVGDTATIKKGIMLGKGDKVEII